MKPSNVLLMIALVAAGAAEAQALYKYVDANGKVTYSDRQPKPGEKATRVNADPAVNVISVSPAVASRAGEGAAAGARAKERAAARDNQQEEISKAEKELENAKKALEDGRDAREGEQQIRVGMKTIKGKDGKPVTVPSGENVVTRNEAYAERIAGLEAAVKAAEERLERAREAARK
jgi:Domain of unknown function (DUF4124)